MLNSWKKLFSAVRFENPWWSYVVETYQLSTGAQGEYNYVHTRGSALIVPVLPDGRLAMVRQYRYLMDRSSVEFPAGGVEEGETFSQSARRELLEETGLSAADLINIGQFCPFVGVTDEWCSIFLAHHLTQMEPSPEATEDIEIITRRPDEIEDMIKRGEIWDGQTLAAWALVRDKLPSTAYFL